MSFSNFLELELLDHLFGCGNRNYAPPANLYVALSTADPLDDASGMAEPSGNGYARVATTSATWDVASGGSVANGAIITFPAATGNWGTITHFALYDAATNGNLLGSGALTVAKNVTSGDTIQFAVGNLTCTLD